MVEQFDELERYFERLARLIEGLRKERDDKELENMQLREDMQRANSQLDEVRGKLDGLVSRIRGLLPNEGE